MSYSFLHAYIKSLESCMNTVFRAFSSLHKAPQKPTWRLHDFWGQKWLATRTSKYVSVNLQSFALLIAPKFSREFSA